MVNGAGQHGPELSIASMSVLFVLALVWISLRSLLLLNQIARHTPEARLGREFQGELRARGLLPEDVHPEGDR